MTLWFTLGPAAVNVAFALQATASLVAAAVLLGAPGLAGAFGANLSQDGKPLRWLLAGSIVLGLAGVSLNVAKNVMQNRGVALYTSDQDAAAPAYATGDAPQTLAATATALLILLCAATLLGNVGGGSPKPSAGPLGMVAPPLYDPHAGVYL